MTLAQRLFFLIIICSLSGCGGDSNSSRDPNLNYLDIQDPEMGMRKISVPFPAGWTLDTNPDDKLVYLGPNNTDVYQTKSDDFWASNDPFKRRTAQMANKKTAPVVPLEQYLNEVFTPQMTQRGYKLQTSYPMPHVKEFWELFAAGMPQGLSRKHFEAIGVEWENSDGSKAFFILVQAQLQKPGMTMWFVTATEMYSSHSEYDNAKEALIYAAANTEVNPQWQIAKNNQLMKAIRKSNQFSNNMIKQSRIAHAERMNSILVRGKSSSSVAQINSDILDISHSGFIKRSSMVTAGQANSVNLAQGQTVINNSNTGEHYKVQSGMNHYWVNNEGKYFGTNNSNYDPRTDNSLNSQQWSRFEVAR